MISTDPRRIRVFVSSTFHDMVEDRNALMTHAWPELRRFCRERQVELVEVDLRWGISEEQSTRKETLKLCLDEIRACRPYFIGLLGERYGWVPGNDTFSADLCEEQPWLKDLQGCSVTELEIFHGVLNDTEMAGRTFFYFRDPRYADTVPPEHKADFIAESVEFAAKQQRLKTLIRDTCSAKHIPLREDYPDPRQLATLVLEDLKAVIDEQYPVADIPDLLTREARDHEAFAEIRRRTYIGREDYYRRLDEHAAGEGPPLVLFGDSGSGKSALLANWIDRWRNEHPDDFIIQHYIGGTPDSADHYRLMSRLIAEIKRWSDDPEELPETHEEILKTFPVWLAKARIRAEHTGVRCLIVLDALNQLEDRDHARRLGWLPEYPFTGPLRLIVSTLPGEALQAVEERGWPTLSIEPLTVDERWRMIKSYLARFSKQLDAPRLERLAAAPAAANPLYLKILLDELRVTGTHVRLDERLEDYLSTPDIPALLRKVLIRYRRDYERDRPKLVAEALGLIFAARRGLTEAELLTLLRPTDLPQLPVNLWSPLRAALEESLVDRGGVLNFAHDFLRAAVGTAFVPDSNREKKHRYQLADYFEAEPPTSRNCDELPWLLWQTEERDRLRACLLDIARFLLIHNRDQEELMRYWVFLKEERSMGQLYTHSFVTWFEAIGRDSPIVAITAYQLACFLEHAALFAAAEPLYCLALTVDENNVGANHHTVARDLNNLASLLLTTNRLAEAEPLMSRVLAIDEMNFGPVHPDVARDLNNLAQLLVATNRAAEAEPLIRRALDIDEKSYGPDHPDVAICLQNLAVMLHANKRLEEAGKLYRRSLAINEKNYGPDHPTMTALLNNLAQLLQDTNQLAEAEPLMRRALTIDEMNFGPVHPDVARDLNNLAQLLVATNRAAEAEPLMRRTLAIDEMNFGPNDPNVARVLNNLASLLQDDCRLAEAELLYRRAVEILLMSTKVNCYVHKDLRAGVGNYVGLLQAMGQSEEQIEQTLRSMAPEYFQ